MNYGEVKQRVRDALGAISGEIDTQVANFIEDAIRDIHAHARWPWDRDALTFTTRGAIVDATATWTVGTTSVVLDTGNVASQSLANEYLNGLIKLNGANVYEISAWDQATATLTLDSEIIDASGTAAGAQIVQDMITLPSSVESVIDVIDYLFPRTLRKKTGHTRQRFWPDPFVAIGGLPFEWWIRGVDSAGDVRMVLYPPPSEDRTYQLEFWKRPSFPASDADEIESVTGIPERFHPVLVAGAKYKAYEFEFENDGVKAHAFAEFARGLANMMETGRPNAGAIRRLKSARVNRRDPFAPQDTFWPSDRVTGV